MIKILPYYKQELSTLQAQLKYLTNDEIVNIIETQANKKKYVDCKKLLDELIEKSVSEKPYPPREWLTLKTIAMLKDQYSDIYKFNEIELNIFEEFRKRRFEGYDVDKYLIEEIEMCAINQPFITAKDVNETFNAIFKYMEERNERSYALFVEYLCRSKLIKQKCNVEITTLKDKVERELKELEELQNAINTKTTRT